MKIGVIGPDDSIKRITHVATYFESIELVNFPYDQVDEIEHILESNRGLVDQWFFSGQSPFYYALEKGWISEKEGSYPPLHGSSFFGALLEAQLKEQRLLHKISIDTISKEEIETALAFHSFDQLHIASYPYEGYRSAAELIDHHRTLYEKGEIETAITCIQSVQKSLTEMGIPCYRVVPTNLSIRMILQYLLERAQSRKYQKSQIAIVGIEVIYSTQTLDESHFSYKMKHQELDLKRNLLDIAQKINGSMVQLGDGLFFVYTTRGELDLHEKESIFSTLTQEVKVHTDLDIRVGLGFGVTVLEAEHHVRLAFQHARKHESSIVVSVNEDKTVTEILPSTTSITYSLNNLGDEWKKAFKDATVSSAIVSKILSLSRHYDKEEITSQDLSRWLKSTERNGRRILTEMERIGIVKISGEEQSGGRGRPRKLYRFQL
ncbi:hypothetical protein LCL96_21070 [Rossellomorea aquimaris]|uniref:hypothetical protein n=1 Tax=Rossellomorea aquimaris TaxID=189382 RepID=UPI001CD22F96|nr:hypothetical protein [Rossellomorea aquimaris]MCA1061412.1 hypothetical protein [Rossellomorea aquimaris]